MEVQDLEDFLNRPLPHIHDLIFVYLDVPARRSCLRTSKSLRRLILERKDRLEGQERHYNWLSAKTAKEFELTSFEQYEADVYAVVDDKDDDLYIFIISRHRITSYKNCQFENTLVWSECGTETLFAWVKDQSLMVLCRSPKSVKNSCYEQGKQKLYRINKKTLGEQCCEETEMTGIDLSVMSPFCLPSDLSYPAFPAPPVPYVKECQCLSELTMLLNLCRRLGTSQCRYACNSSHMAVLKEDMKSLEMISIANGLSKWKKSLEPAASRVFLRAKRQREYCILLHSPTEDLTTLVRVIDAETGKDVKKAPIKYDNMEQLQSVQVAAGQEFLYVQHGSYVSGISWDEDSTVCRWKTQDERRFLTLNEETGSLLFVRAKEDDDFRPVLTVTDESSLKTGSAKEIAHFPTDNKILLESRNKSVLHVYISSCLIAKDGVLAKNFKTDDPFRKERISFFLVNKSPGSLHQYNDTTETGGALRALNSLQSLWRTGSEAAP